MGPKGPWGPAHRRQELDVDPYTRTLSRPTLSARVTQGLHKGSCLDPEPHLVRGQRLTTHR